MVQDRASRAGETDEKRVQRLGISRPTLDRWRKGNDLRLSALAKLAEASGEAIVVRFDPDPADTTKQAPPPEWAEGLVRIEDVARVIDVLSKSGALNETVERLLDLVSAALVPPPDVAQAPRTPATPPEAGPS